MNRKWEPANSYAVGDRVWLDLKNIKTDRPSKKLDDRNKKFMVVEKVRPHAYRLKTPPEIHDVFNVKLLQPATEYLFPSQQTHDHLPSAQMTYRDDDEDEPCSEYIIDKITT